MFLQTDLTELPAAVRSRMHEILTEENGMMALQAKIRQQQIAKFYHDNPPRSRDGLGGMTMAMDPYWANYWRWKLGTERLSQDTDVKKWLLKKHPCFRVKHTGTKLLHASAAIPGGVKRTYKKVYLDRTDRPDPPHPTTPKKL